MQTSEPSVDVAAGPTAGEGGRAGGVGPKPKLASQQFSQLSTSQAQPCAPF